ncbi:MAG: 6-hydroxynicotinate reductase, partial [Acidocella sp.]|nr:6-hydroxynicotinate reductase [Acidocella sp.]
MMRETTPPPAVTAAAAGPPIRCDACPVMCYIKPGMAGACDRYANHDGTLTRTDPHLFIDGQITAIGAGTTYPDYKPAPFIVSAEVDGVDMITVVTEGIFSYCGAKIKV